MDEVNFEYGNLADYNAVVAANQVDNDTLYWILDKHLIFKGSVEFAASYDTPVVPYSEGRKSGVTDNNDEAYIVFYNRADDRLYPISNTKKAVDIDFGLVLVKGHLTISTLIKGNDLLQSGVYPYTPGASYQDNSAWLKLYIDSDGYYYSSGQISFGVPSSNTECGYFYLGEGCYINQTLSSIECNFSKYPFIGVTSDKEVKSIGLLPVIDDDVLTIHPSLYFVAGDDIPKGMIVFKGLDDYKDTIFPITVDDQPIDGDFGFWLLKQEVEYGDVIKPEWLLQKGYTDYFKTIDSELYKGLDTSKTILQEKTLWLSVFYNDLRDEVLSAKEFTSLASFMSNGTYCYIGTTDDEGNLFFDASNHRFLTLKNGLVDAIDFLKIKKELFFSLVDAQIPLSGNLHVTNTATIGSLNNNKILPSGRYKFTLQRHVLSSITKETYCSIIVQIIKGGSLAPISIVATTETLQPAFSTNDNTTPTLSSKVVTLIGYYDIAEDLQVTDSIRIWQEGSAGLLLGGDSPYCGTYAESVGSGDFLLIERA